MNSFCVEALVTVAVRGRFHDESSNVAIKTIIDDGLIEPRGDAQHTYKLTEKGRVMMNALVSVPLPVVAYTMPGKE